MYIKCYTCALQSPSQLASLFLDAILSILATVVMIKQQNNNYELTTHSLFLTVICSNGF